MRAPAGTSRRRQRPPTSRATNARVASAVDRRAPRSADPGWFGVLGRPGPPLRAHQPSRRGAALVQHRFLDSHPRRTEVPSSARIDAMQPVHSNAGQSGRRSAGVLDGHVDRVRGCARVDRGPVAQHRRAVEQAGRPRNLPLSEWSGVVDVDTAVDSCPVAPAQPAFDVVVVEPDVKQLATRDDAVLPQQEIIESRHRARMAARSQPRSQRSSFCGQRGLVLAG